MYKDYEYLTEHEKHMFEYTENIPSEYEPIEDAWNEDYLLEIEALNDILNVK